MGSLALYCNPERAVMVFTKCSTGQQYLEQLDSQGGLADAAGGGAASAPRRDHVPVHCNFINLMNSPNLNEGTLIFLVPA